MTVRQEEKEWGWQTGWAERGRDTQTQARSPSCTQRWPLQQTNELHVQNPQSQSHRKPLAP